MGIKLVLISGGVDLYAEIVAQRLDISDWYANSRLLFFGNEIIGLQCEPDQVDLELIQVKAILGS